MSSDADVISDILRREGWPKFTVLAADRGGPTKGGITLSAWQEFAPGATAADLEALSELQARAFYRVRHITGPGFDRIVDPAVRELAIDAGVHHHPRHASKWLQWAAEVKQDGVLGPISLAAINAAAPGELFLWVLAFRLRLYGRLIQRDPALRVAKAAGIRLQAEFAEGWNNRAAEFLEAAARRIEAQHNARSL